MGVAPEREMKESVKRWKDAYDLRCRRSLSTTAILLQEMKERFDPNGTLVFKRKL